MEVWYHHNGERRFKGVEQESFVAFICSGDSLYLVDGDRVNVGGFDDSGSTFSAKGVLFLAPECKEIPESGTPFVCELRTSREIQTHINSRATSPSQGVDIAKSASESTQVEVIHTSQKLCMADSNEIPTTESGGGSCDSDKDDAEQSTPDDSELPAPIDSTPNP